MLKYLMYIQKRMAFRVKLPMLLIRALMLKLVFVLGTHFLKVDIHIYNFLHFRCSHNLYKHIIIKCILGFHGSPDYSRPVEVNFNVGAEAVDFETLAKKEKLGPLELELRKLETVVKEIVSELTYLKRREARMRDTNGNIYFFSYANLMKQNT